MDGLLLVVGMLDWEFTNLFTTVPATSKKTHRKPGNNPFP